jgi:glycosyltransferase involved in cell wall biosynthesis
MKLLIITEYFWPEEFVISDLAADAVTDGFEVTVLTLQPSYPRGRIAKGYKNEFFSTEVWNGVTILRLKTILGYKDNLFYKLLNYIWFAIIGSMATICLRERYDRVFIYQVGPLTMAIPGIVYGKYRKIPVIIWTQDVWPDSVYAYGFKRAGVLLYCLNIFVHWVYASVHTTLISCKGFEKILRDYTDKPMYYTPNWPLSTYQPDGNLVLPRDERVFLFAGNVGKVQNLDNVIRGFAIAQTMEGFKGILRIVGDGSALKDLKELAEDCETIVEFLGRKPSKDMGEEYYKADFLVLSLADRPVFRLTIPSKFQMYLSVGKPILSAAEGEVRTLVHDLCLGIAADANSAESIAEAFYRLSNANETEISTWSANATKAFCRDFNRNLIVNQILNKIKLSKVIYS